MRGLKRDVGELKAVFGSMSFRITGGRIDALKDVFNQISQGNQQGVENILALQFPERKNP